MKGRKFLAMLCAFMLLVMNFSSCVPGLAEAIEAAAEAPEVTETVEPDGEQVTEEPTEAPTEAPSDDEETPPDNTEGDGETSDPDSDNTDGDSEGSDDPTEAPTEAPTEQPSEDEESEPTEAPSGDPDEDKSTPQPEPTEVDSVTPEPTEVDSATPEPTDAPTEEPTDAPTEEPTETPTEEPTEAPTEEPTEAPTEEPTEAPTEEPTEAPTEEPTEAPTEEPTEEPTPEPTEEPTPEPTEEPVFELADFAADAVTVFPGDTIHFTFNATGADRVEYRIYNEAGDFATGEAESAFEWTAGEAGDYIAAITAFAGDRTLYAELAITVRADYSGVAVTYTAYDSADEPAIILGCVDKPLDKAAYDLKNAGPVAFDGYDYIETRLGDTKLDALAYSEADRAWMYTAGDVTAPLTEDAALVVRFEQQFTRRFYEYDDRNIHAKVWVRRASDVPDDAEFVVRQVTESTRGYNYDAYMDALNAQPTEQEYTAENTLLYDFAFMVYEKDELGMPTDKQVEFQPEAGSIRIQVTFKRNQISDKLGAEEAEAVEVIHLPLDADVRDAVDSTAQATDISADNINIDARNATVNLDGNTDKVEFKVDGLSVIAVTVTNDGSNNYSIDPQPTVKFVNASNIPVTDNAGISDKYFVIIVLRNESNAVVSVVKKEVINIMNNDGGKWSPSIDDLKGGATGNQADIVNAKSAEILFVKVTGDQNNIAKYLRGEESNCPYTEVSSGDTLGKYLISSISDTNGNYTVTLVEAPKFSIAFDNTMTDADALSDCTIVAKVSKSSDKTYIYRPSENLTINGSTATIEIPYFYDQYNTSDTYYYAPGDIVKVYVVKNNTEYGDESIVEGKLVSITQGENQSTVKLTKLPKASFSTKFLPSEGDNALDPGSLPAGYLLLVSMTGADGVTYYSVKDINTSANPSLPEEIAYFTEADSNAGNVPHYYTGRETLSAQVVWPTSGDHSVNSIVLNNGGTIYAAGSDILPDLYTYTNSTPEDHLILTTLRQVPNEGAAHTINVSFYDEKNGTKYDALPEGKTLDTGDVYFFRVRLMQGDKVIAYKIVKAENFATTVNGSGAFTTTLDATTAYQMVDADGHNLADKFVNYDPTMYTPDVRLYKSKDGGIPSSLDTVSNNADDSIPGYDFWDNVFTARTETEQATTNIRLYSGYKKIYQVSVENSDATESVTIGNGDGIQLIVSAEHATTGTDTYTGALAGTTAITTVIENQTGETPVALWNNQTPTGTPITGNEKFTITLSQNGTEIPEGYPVKIGTDYYQVSYAKQRTEEQGGTAESPVTTITDYVVLTKMNLGGALTPEGILGEAAEYGIVANRYDQSGHTETNFAVNHLKDDANIDIGGSGLNDIPFYVGSIDDGSQLKLTSETVVDVDVFVTQADYDAHKIKTEGLKNAFYINIRSQDDINSYVNGMIAAGRSTSASLAGQTTIKPDSLPNNTLDTTLFPDGCTIYVDCTNIKGTIGTSGWKIRKKENQSIVFNLPGSSVKVDKFYVTVVDDIGTVLKTDIESTTNAKDQNGGQDAHNKDVDKYILQHLTFNAFEASSVNINNASGLFLAPNAASFKQKNGAGWILAGGTVQSEAEWHFYRHNRHYKSANANLKARKYVRAADDSLNAPTDTYTFVMEEFVNGAWTEVVGSPVSNSGTNVSFPLITYNDPSQNGAHYFRIHEVVPDSNNDAYDQSWYIIKVDVNISGTQTQSTATGTYYKVTKTQAEAATSASDIEALLATATCVGDSIEDVAFINGKQTQTGKVKVQKAFSGVDALPAGFKITNNYNSDVFTVANKAGGSGTAADPYYWEIDDVPVGTQVTFTESGTDVTGYSLDVTAVPAGGKSAAVEADATKIVTLTNTYSQKKGTLKITKTVDGSSVSKTDFKVEVKKGNLWYNLNGTTSTTKVQVTVKAGGSVTFSNLPWGTYAITEDEEDAAVTGYTLDVTGDTSATIDAQNLNPTANITNTYTEQQQETGKLTVTKTVYLDGSTTAVATDNTEFKDHEYKVTILQVSSGKYLQADETTFGTTPYEFTVKIGQSLELNNLPTGDYTVTETSGMGVDGYNTVSVSTETTKTVTLAASGTTAGLINRYTTKTDTAVNHGSVTVKKMDVDAPTDSSPLAGAKFKLGTGTGDSWTPIAKAVEYVSGADGKFTISTSDTALESHLPTDTITPTTLYLREIEAPAGYEAISTDYTVTISKSESTGWVGTGANRKWTTTTSYSISITGTDDSTADGTADKPYIINNSRDKTSEVNPATVYVRKTDGTSELSGATFTLYKADQTTSLTTFDAANFSISTNAAYLATLLPTTNGGTTTLYLKETAAPKGYTANADWHAIVITASVSSAWTEGSPKKWKTTTTYTMTIGGNGNTTQTAPYAIANTKNTGTATVPASVTVNKVDDASSPKPLTGAIFTLSKSSSDFTSAENVIATYDSATASSITISTNDNALKAYLDNQTGTSFTLYLKETTAPNGYKLETGYHTIAITKSVGEPQLDVDQNKFITTTTYTMTIDGAATKTISNEKDTTEETVGAAFTIIKTDDSATPAPLGGATFGLFATQDCSGDPIATFVTSSVEGEGKGKVTLSSTDAWFTTRYGSLASAETLYLKETNAPGGYTASTTVYPLRITKTVNSDWTDTTPKQWKTTTTYTITYNNATSVTVVNTRNVGQNIPDLTFTLHKQDGDGAALPGATFTLTKQGVTGNVDEQITPASGDVTLTISGTTLGTHNGVGDTTTTRTFTLTETPPAGYIGDGPWTVTVKANSATVADDTDGTQITTYNWTLDSIRKTGEEPLTTTSGKYTITNTKDTVTTYSYGKVTLKKTGEGDDSAFLPGAVFALTSANTEITTYTSGQDGKFEIDTALAALHDYLPKDDGEANATTLTLKEKTAPAGYKLNPNAYTVKITRTTGDEYLDNTTNKYTTPVTYSVTITDTGLTGTGTAADPYVIANEKTSVKVSKVDATTHEELEGAHIQILDNQGNVVEEWDSTTEAHVVTGLKTGVEYTLRETVAPNGYKLTSDTKFSINEDGTVTTNGSTTTDDDGNTVLLVEDTALDTPEFDKKVRDKNDTTETEYGGWQDAADHDIGDAVPFRLHATLSTDVSSFVKYHITFTDEMTTGLTFNEITSITVDDTEVYTPTPSASNPKVEVTPEGNQKFTVTLTWESSKGTDGKYTGKLTGLDGAEVFVYFTATLNKDAVLGSDGNVNSAKLSYSNNPSVTKDSQGNETPNENEDETEWDSVIVFTYKVEVDKVDQDGGALTGATFKLEKKLADGSTTVIETVEAQPTTKFTFTGLDDGTYQLTETVAPDGYLPIDPITFTIAAGHLTDWDGDAAKKPTVYNENGVKITSANLTFTKQGSGSYKTDVENKQTSVKVSKVDATTYEELSGARIQILSSDGTVVEEWTSGTTPHEVKGLNIGEKYTLRETVAPNGYDITSDTTFTINADGTVTTTGSKTDDGVLLVKDTLLDTPEFEKKVEDTNDTTGETSDWQDAADHDIGDAVPYRLHAKLPTDVSSFVKYHITFHDTMDASLDFNASSVKIEVVKGGKAVGTAYAKALDSDKHGFDLTLTWEAEKNGGKYTGKLPTDLNGADVYVYFTATLNEKANLGSKGNVNTAYLEYSDNPSVTQDGQGNDQPNEHTDETEEDSVIVFTYTVEVDKVDQDGEALKGATFKLEKLDANGKPLADQAKYVTGGSGSVFTFTGLDDGTYQLTETVVPDGYLPIDPITFTVKAGHKIDWDGKDATKPSVYADPQFSGGSLKFTAITGGAKANVVNEKYTAEGSLTFEGTKSIEGRSLTSGDIFEFEIILEGGGSWNQKVWTVKNDATGKIAFPTFTYSLDEAGRTYTYKVREQSPSTDKITKDETRYEIKVQIVDNGDGTLTAKVLSGNPKKLDFVNKPVEDKTPAPTTAAPTTAAPTATATPAPTTAAPTTAAPTTAAPTTAAPTTAAPTTAAPTTAAPTATATATPGPNNDTTPKPAPAPTELVGKKVWLDENNKFGTRPDSITVELYANGVLVPDAKPTWKDTKTNAWTYTFSKLPTVDEAGKSITYTVREVPVENYESSVNGTTITNKLIPSEIEEFTNLTGLKTWNDADNASGKRPESITVHLLRDGVVVETLTVTAADNWRYTFENQPVDNGYGHVYTYTVREDAVPGYYCRTNGLDLTNYLLEIENEEGKKTPNNDEDNVPNRNTKTDRPKFEQFDVGELEDLMVMLDYGTPLWGQLLGTGDETPAYPFVFGGIGVLALAVLLITRKKRRIA